MQLQHFVVIQDNYDIIMITVSFITIIITITEVVIAIQILLGVGL